MKLKLDENLGTRGYEILSLAGHDVATVATQLLQESEDADLIEACRNEQRALVSLDLDFANPFRFRPSLYAGIAILRLPRKPNSHDLLNVIHTLASGLQKESLNGKCGLWKRGEFGYFKAAMNEYSKFPRANDCAQRERLFSRRVPIGR